MSTTYSEDHPDRKVEESVAASPVEGLDREPAAVEAKVVEAAETKPAAKKTSRAKTK